MDDLPPTAPPNRRSSRLQGFDYASDAAYVVTLCTHNRRPLFGTIADGMMRPSSIGVIVEREWRKTPDIRPGVLLDELGADVLRHSLAVRRVR